MKTVRRACNASILTLALSLSAFAGEIHTTVTPPTPDQQATRQGEIQTTNAGDMETGLTTGTKFAFDVILSVLALT